MEGSEVNRGNSQVLGKITSFRVLVRIASIRTSVEAEALCSC